MRVFFFPVRAITGASVYCRTEDLSVLTRNLKKVTEGDIYYISDEKNLVEKSEGVCVFRKEYEISQDDGSDHGGWIPLPGSFTSSQAQISVYRCTGESRLEYNMADSLLALNGFGDLEGEFRWIRAQEASVSCRVEPGHYYLQIFCAWQEKAPLNQTGSDRMKYIPLLLYSLRWNIETSYYEQKTFWSFCNYMVRSCKGIEMLVNLINISYCAMTKALKQLIHQQVYHL